MTTWKRTAIAATALAMAVLVGAPSAEALCIRTTCATASIDYSCTNGACAFEADGTHEGIGTVSGVLEAYGSAIAEEIVPDTCSGAPSCTTSLAGPAVENGCAFAKATTRAAAGYSSSDTSFDCDDSTLALLQTLGDLT